MKQGGMRIFEDEVKLQEMLSLRRVGWGFSKLGRKYHCDHTSIIYQCQKYLNAPKKVKIKQEEKPKPVFKIKEGHCPKCDLLLTSEFSCDHCINLK